MKKSIRLSLVFAAGLAAAALVRADAPAPGEYVVQKPIHIGGPGRWDYAVVDAAAHRLYVTRTTHTQAIDLATGKVVLDIDGQKGSHGTAVVPRLGRGFITDGKAGNIVIFDLKTGDVLGHAAAATDADGTIYDAGTDRVLAGCGDANQLAVLDPAADPATAKAELIDLGGSPEFLAADGHGKAYVNLNDKGEVAVVDLRAKRVIARYPTGADSEPTGLAIDPVKGRLFVGCRNKKLVVLGTVDGKVLAELPIGTGNDACGFDPGTGDAFASCGDGTVTVAREASPGTFAVAQTVHTPRGARTMAVDPTTHVLYLPTAEFGPAATGSRPAAKPGTFMVVVVAPAGGK
jgi:DNA-binding beta-propeller fold protein YncE